MSVQRIRFFKKILRIKKAANTPQGFVRQMEKCGPQGEWRLAVSYKTTRKPKYEIYSEDYTDIYIEAWSLKELLNKIKDEAEHDLE